MNDLVKCSQFVVLTENEEEYYDILGIFSPFLQNLINWTKLDSKLDYFGCTETLDITEFFNKMLFFGQ